MNVPSEQDTDEILITPMNNACSDAGLAGIDPWKVPITDEMPNKPIKNVCSDAGNRQRLLQCVK